MTPEQARRVRELMRWSDETIQEMEQVLTRWRASAAVLTNLEGLLTANEIQGYGRLLVVQLRDEGQQGSDGDEESGAS